MLQLFFREAMLPGFAEHGSVKIRRKHGLRTPKELSIRRGNVAVGPPYSLTGDVRSAPFRASKNPERP